MLTRVSLLLVCLLACGCAVEEARNRRTLNVLDRHLAPESTAARWAVAPVALPIGLVALAADAIVVHPSTVFDDAWYDTVDWLWTPKPGESRFRRAVLFPLVVLATPPVYVGDWLGRSIFRIRPRSASRAVSLASAASDATR